MMDVGLFRPNGRPENWNDLERNVYAGSLRVVAAMINRGEYHNHEFLGGVLFDHVERVYEYGITGLTGEFFINENGTIRR